MAATVRKDWLSANPVVSTKSIIHTERVLSALGKWGAAGLVGNGGKELFMAVVIAHAEVLGGRCWVAGEHAGQAVLPSVPIRCK